MFLSQLIEPYRLEEFNWLRSVTTPPVEPQAQAQIEEKNGSYGEMKPL